jgi:hypothetical protein
MNRQVALRVIYGAILVAAFAAIPAYAQQPPMPPHVFYGSAAVNGQPAPVGAQVEARGTGIKTTKDNPAIEDNPLTVTVAGQYGGPRARDHQLIVQGEVEDGTPIEFYINGVRAQCAVPGGPWQASYPYQAGMFTELNLKVGEASVPPTSSTATATRKPNSTDSGESVQATATRQTPQAVAGTGTQPPPTAAVTTAPSPASAAARAAASATAQGQVVVATPTNLAAPGIATTPSATPTFETAATPSATLEPATSTAPSPPTLTPAVVAQAPRATSNPIIGPETPLPAEQSSAQSPTDSGSASATSGRMLALWGGVAALAIAAGAGVVFLVRARSR